MKNFTIKEVKGKKLLSSKEVIKEIKKMRINKRARIFYMKYKEWKKLRKKKFLKREPILIDSEDIELFGRGGRFFEVKVYKKTVNDYIKVLYSIIKSKRRRLEKAEKKLDALEEEAQKSLVLSYLYKRQIDGYNKMIDRIKKIS